MNTPPYIIVEEIAIAVAATKTALALDNLNYMYGYINEVNQTIEQDSKTVEFAALTFPCVLVKLPFSIVNFKWGWFGKTSGLDIIIMTGSTQQLKAQQRTDQKFKPTLIPIEIELLKQLGKLKAFDNHWPDRMPYTSIDNYFWGTDGKQKSALTSIVDSIVIRDLELKVNNNPNCLVPTLAVDANL